MRKFIVLLVLISSVCHADPLVKGFSLNNTDDTTLSEVDRFLINAKEKINKNAINKYCWYIGGTVSTGASQDKTFNDIPFDILPRYIRLHADTGPAGANLIIDINDDGTTIFNTRAEIDDGGTEQDGNHEFKQQEIEAGSDITFDVDQVGSGTAGSDLTVCLYAQS